MHKQVVEQIENEHRTDTENGERIEKSKKELARREYAIFVKSNIKVHTERAKAEEEEDEDTATTEKKKPSFDFKEIIKIGMGRH